MAAAGGCFPLAHLFGDQESDSASTHCRPPALGAVYSTNVALAPTSRDLFPQSPESFQIFAAPELEYAAVNTPGWRLGPTLKGHFSLNEGSFQERNLQSDRPGLFVEHLIPLESVILVPRLADEFTHDEFAGETFGNRHALSLSSTVYRANADESVVYWVGDHTVPDAE